MTVSLNIDGRPVDTSECDTILTAARGLGVEIPTLCQLDGLPADGGCRLCAVDIEGESQPKAACYTKVRSGMVVRTKSVELSQMRRELLSLYCSRLGTKPNADGFKGGRRSQDFAKLLKQFDVSVQRDSTSRDSTSEHPYLGFDESRCIVCRRCINICDNLQGQFVFNVADRGNSTRLIFGETENFLDSPCVSCGSCVDACPTGALFDVDGIVLANRVESPTSVNITRSVCGYCGVGCNIDIESDGDTVFRIRGSEDSIINRGHLCAKGRYAHGYLSSSDRLTKPLLRSGNNWQEIPWDEAIGWVSNRLISLRDRFGPDSLGVFTSSRSTNEAAYLLQKLFRTAIGTNNVDCCARVCHASTALGLRLATGAGAATASYADIEHARVIVIAGANPTEAHPVVGARIKQAVRRGAKVIVIDPRRIELAECADLHLQLAPGTNVALFNALAKVLVEADLIDREYLDARTEGLDKLAEYLSTLCSDSAAKACGVSSDAIQQASELIGKQGPCLFVHGLGLSELTQGTGSVMALANLGMLSGSIGRKGAGMLPLRGQNNVQGNADMGSMPNLLTGYQSLAEPSVRERVQETWGVAPPIEAGLTIPEMIDAAVHGKVRGLWIQGEDVAQSDPNRNHVIEGLKNLDLLVVQELFMSETAQLAHLVLPAAGALEQDGTFTNGERRVQRVHAATSAPGDARPDWEVAQSIGIALGQDWKYDSCAEVMDEIAAVAPDLFGGVTYNRLGINGLQWPCPDVASPGTETVHADGFIRGRGALTVVEYEPSPEQKNDRYPYLLITGRVLQHYNVGTMTRRTPNDQLISDDFLEIHPHDADSMKLVDGAGVRLESRYGHTKARIKRTNRVDPGMLFLSFHYPGTQTNNLTSNHVDRRSKCPEYKITAVRLTAL